MGPRSYSHTLYFQYVLVPEYPFQTRLHLHINLPFMTMLLIESGLGPDRRGKGRATNPPLPGLVFFCQFLTDLPMPSTYPYVSAPCPTMAASLSP